MKPKAEWRQSAAAIIEDYWWQPIRLRWTPEAAAKLTDKLDLRMELITWRTRA